MTVKSPAPPPHQPLWELSEVVSSWAHYGISHKSYFFPGNIQIAVLNGVLDCENMIRQL